MNHVAERIHHAACDLPEADMREVLDFITFLKNRSRRSNWENIMNAQSIALSDVWDNDEDEVWNHV